MGATTRVLFQSDFRFLKISLIFLFLSNLIFSQENISKKENFQTIIDENKGKVIYLEFWASWCGPCIKEIKHTKKLQEKFSDKDITFIFLSIDKDENKWINASKKLKLYDYKYNLLTSRLYISENLKDLEIKAIPHYIIINKKGEIADINAPSPDSDEIISHLYKYLQD